MTKPHKFRARGPLRPALSGPRTIELLIDADSVGVVEHAMERDATAVCVPYHGTRKTDPLWRVLAVYPTFQQALLAYDAMPAGRRAIIRMQDDVDVLVDETTKDHVTLFDFKPSNIERRGEKRVVKDILSCFPDAAKLAPSITLVSR